jgi:putative transposase
MKKQSTGKTDESSITWNNLEQWIRGHVQNFIQGVLEEEVTDLLGRQKSVRRQPVATSAGYRNGYGKPRRLTLSCGTITV